MLTLLHRFAALTLLLTAMRTLLPEGSLRRTAMMCAGLIALLCCLEAVPSLSFLPQASEAQSILKDTNTSAGDLSSALEVYTRQAERAQHEE